MHQKAVLWAVMLLETGTNGQYLLLLWLQFEPWSLGSSGFEISWELVLLWQWLLSVLCSAVGLLQPLSL